MSNEIATYSMILSKLSLGKSGTECPTKTQILAINSLIIIDNASTYGANECVKIDDIRKKVETWNYYLTVSPTSMSFGAGGGSKSFTVSSYKRKVLDGVEQSGDTSVSLKSTVISGTGFSLSGTTVSASANESTSSRSGTVTITQNESNKTATISLSQSGDTASSYGEWVITVSANPTSVSSSGGTSTITASAKRTIYWESGDVTEETGNPTLSTNLGSLSSTASPSTLTLGENTSTSSRTATITASYSGKSATCTVTQSGKAPVTNWVFQFDNGRTTETMSASYDGSSTTFGVVSTKDGAQCSFSAASSASSWLTATVSGTTGVTVKAAANTSESQRSGTITLTQSGSGKTITISVTQAGAEPTIEYVFTISPWQVNVGASGGTGDIGFTSYKLVNGNQISLGYSIDSSTLPSWATYSNGRFTISSNSSTSSRSANVYFTQSESGKRYYATISQSGYVPPADNYVFTWEGGSTSDVSASFPWDFSANGTAANIPVISTKNGSSQSWSVSSKPSWITTSTTSSKVTISAADNSGSARSGEVVLTQSGSGKTLTVNVSQDAKPAENVYVFTITPNTYDASYSSASFIPRTVSTKNGSNIGYSLTSGDTDWVVVSTTGKITVEIMKNTTSSSRSTTLVFTQNESGKTQSIEITQSGQPAEYKFGFGSDLYSTDSVTCDYQGGEFRNFYQVVSTKNGSNQSYYVSRRPTWINGYSSGKVSIQENTSTASRNGDVILTQDESGKTITLKVTQRGKPEEYLSIFNSDISTTAEYAVVNFKSSQPWTCGLTDYDADNPVTVGNTTGDASDTAQVPITYYKEYRRPRRVNYNIRQTAGQKLTASGSITFN